MGRALPIGLGLRLLGCALIGGALAGCTALVDGDTPFGVDAGPDAQTLDAGLDASAIDDAAVDASPDCPDDVCSAGETCSSCPADCCDAGADDGGIDGGVDTRATIVAAGATHSCAATSTDIYCWGGNDHGQLGNRTTGPSAVPVRVAWTMGAPRQLCAGNRFTCALAADGSVWCWGAGTEGQLGEGRSVDRSSPVQAGRFTRVGAITCGADHACAMYPSAGHFEVSCWGSNASGQVGVGVSAGAVIASPAPVSGPGLEASSLGAPAIEAGLDHTCVSSWSSTLGGDGTVTLCWGSNVGSKITSTTVSTDTPVPSRPTSTSVRGAYTGYGLTSGQTCGFRGANIDCWRSPVSSPVLVNAPSLSWAWEEISGGDSFVCARANGDVYCWGDDGFAQLGGSTSTAPLALEARDAPGSLSAGGTHACVIDSTGRVRCWGDNVSGQAVPGAGARVDAPMIVELVSP